MTGRFLPDKAIDALDEAGARSRMDSLKRPPEIEDLSDEIKEVCALKEGAISDQKFEEAAEARDKEKKLRAKQERVLENWKKIAMRSALQLMRTTCFKLLPTGLAFLLTAWKPRNQRSF